MAIDGRVPAVMILITCSIKAAVCSRNLSQWEEAECFARNATVILDSLEPKLGKNIRAQVDQTAYSRIFGEWRVKSLMVMAQASAEKQNIEQAIKFLTRAQDVIGEYSAPEFAQQPLLKPSVKRLRAQDKEILRLQAQCIRQRQAELRAREMLRSSPQVADGEEKKEEADAQPVYPAPLPRERLPNASTLDEMSTTPKEGAAESMRENASFSNAQGHQDRKNSIMDNFDQESELAWYHRVRALTGVLAAVLVLGFTVRGSRR
jgi:hypothetical protein